jgi:hypothetical protein
LPSQKACNPAAHPALASDDQSAKGVSLIDRVSMGRLLLDCLADQEGCEVPPENLVEPEKRARLFEPLIHLRFDLEVSQWDSRGVLELADLASEFEPLTDEMQNSAVEGFDIPSVLLEKRSGRFAS